MAEPDQFSGDCDQPDLDGWTIGDLAREPGLEGWLAVNLVAKSFRAGADGRLFMRRPGGQRQNRRRRQLARYGYVLNRDVFSFSVRP